MVVLVHSLVAPPWSNRWPMVMSSLLWEQFNVFSFMSVFFLGSVHDMIINKIFFNSLLNTVIDVLPFKVTPIELFHNLTPK